jgi:hypothetical protein
MALPIIQHPDQAVMLMQRNWKSKLDPVFQGQFLNGKAINNITLKSGSTAIPHGLSGIQRGWVITDVNSPVTIYRSAPFDNKNLTLTSNAACVINLWVF